MTNNGWMDEIDDFEIIKDTEENLDNFEDTIISEPINFEETIVSEPINPELHKIMIAQQNLGEELELLRNYNPTPEINEKIQIISKGITEYKEYEDYEYITVTVLIKGYNYKQDKFGNNYGLDSFEKYSKYTITYSNLTDKSKEEKQGECSSCGAPLNIENGRCAYCGKYIGDTYSDILIININKKFWKWKSL